MAGLAQRVINAVWAFRQGHKAAAARRYDLARTPPWAQPWQSAAAILDADIRAGLSAMRGRSRSLAQNDAYIGSYLRRLKNNVVGPNGVEFESLALNDRGEPDETARAKIEDAFARWSELGVPSVDGMLTFTDLQNLNVEAIARDGEQLVRHVTNWQGNRFGYAQQVIEPEFLDERYSRKASGGNDIIMGVELDGWRRRVAYYITSGASSTFGAAMPVGPAQAVPAAEIMHLFTRLSWQQTRGVPWTHAVGWRTRQIGSYEEAALVAAKTGASKMGFIKQTTGQYVATDPRQSEDTSPANDQGRVVQELTPNSIEILPMGTEFDGFDPGYPDGEMGEFTRHMLRGAAAGLGVSYHGLSADLSDVNFSSLRQGNLDERDIWRAGQVWLKEHYLTPTFTAWLPWAILTRQVDLPMAKIDRWLRHGWKARGWAWIDPLKEEQANTIGLENKTKSRTEIASDQGKDFKATARQIAEENRFLEGLGLPTAPAGTAAPQEPVEVAQE